MQIIRLNSNSFQVKRVKKVEFIDKGKKSIKKRWKIDLIIFPIDFFFSKCYSGFAISGRCSTFTLQMYIL